MKQINIICIEMYMTKLLINFLYEDLSLNISIKTVTNIDGPPILYDEILEPGQGATEYVYSIKILMNDFECVETNEETWNEDNKSVNFNYNSDIIHKADIKARNSFYSGVRFILNRKKYSYIKNEESKEEDNIENDSASKKDGSKLKKKKSKKLTQTEIDELKKLYTKTLMETMEIYDVIIPLDSFLHGEKYIENEYILNPLVDENLLKRVDSSQSGDKKKSKKANSKNGKTKNKETDSKGKDKKKNLVKKDSKEIEDKESIDLTKKISFSIKLN
ncbi:hypothetical protein PIROE2DRAFT_61833 [Piromyces sp. E2]|nr:hypothetical protein PIROE2DRAFT_61833 [Piromyces sp. E2]|eukprot:OUM62524.1 hypothetical protein PIROE2DRAFT_61833 [Piromyces sp. E2]